ncbi:unnamed protein product [Rotaria sp. Silwood2]|nr:unnamed protein product [Rotaria sp. Silwood2]CAF2851052.1 unnamed protein product [Rotaria sp. Silwood2]CAF3238840.1 unnamed protein product [Rotaria sp. Silwood2]CAF4004756.1 unnamed protein product [Rotaria sp. Silwood2]CAF4021566.1 unnamed protein product [Rotaria sp. Silwood2]
MACKSPILSIKEKSSVSTNGDENKENITLIWLDPNIGSRENTEITKQQLRSINDYVAYDIDLERCIKFIQITNKIEIFLITSGSKSITNFTSNLYDYLLNEYYNIIGIYINLDDLCKLIKEQTDLVNRQMQTFSFFDQHEKSIKDLSKESVVYLVSTIQLCYCSSSTRPTSKRTNDSNV